jgi:hypothetical protein
MSNITTVTRMKSATFTPVAMRYWLVTYAIADVCIDVSDIVNRWPWGFWAMCLNLAWGFVIIWRTDFNKPS